jgi:hypothetical protein
MCPVSFSAFVAAYRCGAVPDSHRIPFSLSVGDDQEQGQSILGLAELQALYVVFRALGAMG